MAIKKLTSDLRDVSLGDYTDYFIIHPIVKKIITEHGSIEDEMDMFHWNGHIIGPIETPYHNNKYKIDITIPLKYPNEPPVVKFISSIFHPNISINGAVCLNILRSPPNGDWKPSINLPNVILCIHNLLSYPNPQDPLNYEAGKLYDEDKDAFNLRARRGY